MFSLIWTWTNGWVNNREAGDLRRQRAHYAIHLCWHVMLLAIDGIGPSTTHESDITAQLLIGGDNAKDFAPLVWSAGTRRIFCNAKSFGWYINWQSKVQETIQRVVSILCQSCLSMNKYLRYKKLKMRVSMTAIEGKAVNDVWDREVKKWMGISSVRSMEGSITDLAK